MMDTGKGEFPWRRALQTEKRINFHCAVHIVNPAQTELSWVYFGILATNAGDV
jgi:hypothetical protein